MNPSVNGAFWNTHIPSSYLCIKGATIDISNSPLDGLLDCTNIPGSPVMFRENGYMPTDTMTD
jgi:hypothetical protein